MSVAADSAAPSASAPRWWWRRLRRLVGVLLVALIAFLGFWVHAFWGWPFNGSRHTRVPVTPAWALECWLWEDDRNTAAAVRELLDGYARHDIPVRTVLIDSPWSTRYNDFTVDEQRYPEPEKFFRELQQEGYRVVLWMTCMVNRANRDTAVRDATGFYDEARRRGYLAGNGHTMRWWKGIGGFIDYTNPDAMRWWHGLQQPLLEWGIDGWKLDGTDTLFSSAGVIPGQRVRSGWLSTREYMDLYAREEYRNGLRHNPEFIILTRAIDNRYFPLSHPEGFAPLDAAPVTWVGDRIHAWSSKGASGGSGADAMRTDESWLDRGFEGALRDILASSAKGYCVVGDDVAGYHGPEPIPPRLYIRWAQFAAFTGLFLNGGHGERALWKRSPQELEIIRRFAWLHTELVPYMYSYVAACAAGGPPLMRPQPGDYHYRFGDDLLVAPIYRDDPTNTVRLPAGRWRAWLDDREVKEGPATFSRRYELEEFPVYVREGAVIPLHVSRPYSGFGDATSAGFTTWLVYPAGRSTFTLEQPDGTGRTRIDVDAAPELRVRFTGVHKPVILRIKQARAPAEVRLDGIPLARDVDWRFDAARELLWIRARDYVDGHFVVH